MFLNESLESFQFAVYHTVWFLYIDVIEELLLGCPRPTDQISFGTKLTKYILGARPLESWHVGCCCCFRTKCLFTTFCAIYMDLSITIKGNFTTMCYL